MAKNIIFCADGTWNGPGEGDSDAKSASHTNVFKTFLNLDGTDSTDSYRLSNEQEKYLSDRAGQVGQVAKYLHGVGDSDNFLVKMLGGSLGAGLITRIVRGYTFVSRNYQTGDKIFLVGFSRGAYTARALAGLIASRGLLDAAQLDLSDKDNAYRLGAAVWYANRKATIPHQSWLGRLEATIVDLPGFVSKPPTDKLIFNLPIEAVAVWDTVGSLGIPVYNEEMVPVDAFQFCDTKLSPKIAHGFHCVAIDEQRANFTPTLWDADARAIQVLFSGAHADVGGGYAICGNESGLSDIALLWMTRQLTALGLTFRAEAHVIPTPDSMGVAHQPWMHSPWTSLKPGPRARTLDPGLKLHQSVVDRMNGGPIVSEPGRPPGPYRPSNLSGYSAADAVP